MTPFTAVLVDPRDTHARLVYADYLDEHESHKAQLAELIRVHCRMSQLKSRSASCDAGQCQQLGFGPCSGCQLWDRLEQREGELAGTGGVLAPSMARLLGLDRFPRAEGVKLDRGLVGTVRLRLADFLGGDCPDCTGPDAVEEDLCFQCRQGQVPRLAGPLFKWMPITRVEPVGKEGGWTAFTGGPAVRWERGDDDDPHTLPPELWDRLADWSHKDWPWVCYRTSELADAALSAAAVRLGRDEAGFEPLVDDFNDKETT